MKKATPLKRATLEYLWRDDTANINWDQLSELYRIAPLGDKSPGVLQEVFGNSMYTCFVSAGDDLVGAGRALADGLDCAYIADVAMHPDHQGRGLGFAMIRRLVELAGDHKKIILYANPGTESFYTNLGFHKMKTAMAIWNDNQRAIAKGLIEPNP